MGAASQNNGVAASRSGYRLLWCLPTLGGDRVVRTNQFRIDAVSDEGRSHSSRSSQSLSQCSSDGRLDLQRYLGVAPVELAKELIRGWQ